MAKYRHGLPLTRGERFLTDGGMETTLIFHEGVDLPHFASFVLMASPEGRRKLKDYYIRYLELARSAGVGFVLDTPTWRASPDWADKLGYDADALKAVNEEAIGMLVQLRKLYERPGQPIVLNGAIGPRGDGYKAGTMSADEAEAYHRPQVETFAATEADMVSAVTLTNIDEAIGVARAARKAAIPCVIAFTVETDGRIVTGRTLQEAIEAVDAATGSYPLFYMVNCAHPSHFEDALDHGSGWIRRVGGIRANASALSHQELDESETLDAGDPEDFGRRYRAFVGRMPQLRLLGGCCGTDHRHIGAICRACMSQPAMSA
ncbi:homocysteine S-methyltransferase family protein (plasmid) [Rhizobium sp. TRM96647]|uniref:homocysteine S-methyltransferase family protein n=1 Tax=unclassified Rhizobium TaxID=2613769 RepID=UPI0021E8808B|nr:MULTISPECIES: homocysteine S-methyltransferase family protein [unclassified Rhizobium]MCV3735655.1 homocysteine S-methyltransferase family protein [Rhizobium sp. TRM96647]MCV3757582.1 homocysteine S-methyltransferase family protein [Rhizobium sp. TRM96650]